ncbi:MAG: phosphopyruvate hydratase [Candidatus Bathyarchaeia archaeon]
MSQEIFRIKSVRAREILDSRGNPTIEVDVIAEGGARARADVPSGRSRGKYEAFELRDGGSRYAGRGVLTAVRNVNEVIGPKVTGMDVRNQKEIDSTIIELDGTENKSKLGGNAIVGVSLAVARVAAEALGLPLYRFIGGPQAHILPVPMIIMINGGKLGATDLDFQEFNAMPIGAEGFSEAMRLSAEVYFKLGERLAKRSKYALNVGDEGAYSPPGISDPHDAFDEILRAIEELGYEDKFVLAMDAAASHLYDKKHGKYRLMGKEFSRENLMDLYEELVDTLPLKSIEDPFDEDDFEGFIEVTKTLGRIQIVGDDFFVTNLSRVRTGVESRAANAVLWKVNQIGTLSEALDVAQYAVKNGYSVVASERSGQTEDTWLADLTVAIGAGQLKNGAPCRSERTAQFNQLLRIEEELGESATYAGANYRRPI